MSIEVKEARQSAGAPVGEKSSRAGARSLSSIPRPRDVILTDRPVSGGPAPDLAGSHFVEQFANVNRELWLILSMLAIAAVANYLVAAQQVVLGFYTLPTIFAAFYRGRRHAVLTAAASALLVGLMAYTNPALRSTTELSMLRHGWVLDMLSWGLTLMLMAYAMGTLHERHLTQTQELRRTYHGVLLILRQFISKDKYTENHSYRVSVYAVTLAQIMGLSSDQRELVRAAALLHDIGKLDISRDILHKASRLSEAEMNEVKSHARKGASLLEPVSVSMGHILPIVLAHHDRFDGTGYNNLAGEEIPLEARIIAVADVFDALTSDRPYRKALPPCEARDIIVDAQGKEYDPAVVTAFQRAYDRGLLEVPEIYI